MIDNSKEYILCAAIWFDVEETLVFQPKNMEKGMVLTGLRHCHCFDIASRILKDNYKNGKVQGFLTSKDRFVDRREASQIAQDAGQLKEAKQRMDGSYERLFSEDLY